MAYKRWDDVRKSKLSASELAAIDQRVQAELIDMDLRTIREILGMTQTELASRLEKTQAEISRVEKRHDHLLSTLRSYVEALGGELEVIAKFADKTVRLRSAV
jgi:transcriptional regulator with XRE-family HTH domain